MNPIALVALLIAGASAQYGQTMPAVRMEPYGSQSAPASYGSQSAPSSYGSATRAAAIPIIRFNQEIRGSESSSVDFETGNGIRQTESTKVVQGRGGSYQDSYGKTVESTSSLSKQGNFAYTSPEGQNIRLDWTADENGFRATGDHLPTSPPIPAEIAASLRANSASSYGSNSGSYSAQSAPSYSAPAAPSYSAPAAPAAPVQVSYGSSVRSGGY